jgi:hypothetical protein
MVRKVLLLVGLMLVLSLGFAAAASAATADASDVEGSGRLWAKGIGYAEVHGNGAVDISVHGTGTILVKGAEMLHAEGQGRRYAAAKVAGLLEKRHGIALSRKTAWAILRRCGVWEPYAGQKRAVQRFERKEPNELWQIDLIEKEPTTIGDVYGVPILDHHSRYLIGLRFFLTKGAETTLLTTYLAMAENGTPAEMLCDRGGQFVDPTGVGSTHFQEVLKALGIQLRIAWRAQTKGKEERLNQFTELDFLDEVRWQVESLADLNDRADLWRQEYNQTHVNETIRCTPAERYQAGISVDTASLKRLFAKEERRKVTREATVRFRNRQFRVPEKYISWSVWVANFFDQYVEIRAGDQVIGTFQL